MQAFFDLSQPRNMMADLRAFYDFTENHIGKLLSLEITQDSYGALLIPVIWGKLPTEVRQGRTTALTGALISSEKHC